MLTLHWTLDTQGRLVVMRGADVRPLRLPRVARLFRRRM